MKMLGDAISACEESDEVLGNIERLDGTDAEARKRRFIENAANKVEEVRTWRKVASPGAEVDAAEDNFLKARIAEAIDF